MTEPRPPFASVLRTLDPDGAVECAAAEASRYFLSSRAFQEAIQDVRYQFEKYARAGYRICRRSVALQWAPAASSHQPLQQLPTIEGVDPWQADPEVLEASKVFAACPECDPPRSEACAGCAGSGVVSAWLRIEEEHLTWVSVSLEYLARRVHPEVGDLEDFERPVEEFSGALELDTGWQSELDDIPLALQVPLNPLTDRVEGVRVQEFLIPIYSITYKLRQGRGKIDVAGLQPRVLPWSNWKPLKLRLVVLGMAIVAVLAAGIAAAVLVPSWQATAHPPSALAIVMMVVVASLVTAILRSRRFWAYARRHLPSSLGGRVRSLRVSSHVTVTRTAVTGV